MLRLVTLVILMILSAGPACVPMAPGGTGDTPASGIEGAFSQETTIANNRHTVMIGRVLVLRQAGRVALTAEVAQRYNSGQWRLRMDSAWHEGERLRFRGTRRAEPYFIGGIGDMRGYRTGVFALTLAEYDQALATGLTATLIGPDAAVEVHFLPVMFAEARDRAQTIGIWPGS